MVGAAQVPMPGVGQEADLQQYVNARCPNAFRIPDGFWRWIWQACPEGVRWWLYKTFGGMPDVTLFAPIGERYALALGIELKQQGRYLRPSQKKAARRFPWVVCRTVEDFEEAVSDFKRTARSIVRQNGLQTDTTPPLQRSDAANQGENGNKPGGGRMARNQVTGGGA